jgi:hypothetical protein
MDSALARELIAIYEQIMWLARQPGVTPSMARAWYTHVWAEKVKRRIRQFTGQVSARAVSDPAQVLRLEHYLRIQTSLTGLVTEHLAADRSDPEAFIQMLTECERVHIVTFRENYDAQSAAGDYLAAGIDMVPWASIAVDIRAVLWRKMLRGRVANARAFQA